MKTYIFLFLMVFGLAIVGCTDLEEEPRGILSTEGFFDSPQALEVAVNGAYTQAINEEIWGRKLSIALLLRSDMVNLQSSQTRRVEMDTHTVTDNNEMVFDPWDRMYQGIALANTVVAEAPNIEGDEDAINEIVARARFIRAFYYFHLVRLHGSVPITDATQDREEQAVLFSSTADEVYAHIVADLEYAEQWLPNTQPSRAIPAKGAATSYLALVALTRGDYQEAYDKATEVINNAGLYGYALDPDFQTLFNANVIDNSPEPIFALDYNNFEAPDNAYDQTAPMTGIRGDDINLGGGWSVAVPTMAVYESFEEGDYRRTVSFEEEASIGGQVVTFENFTISGHEHAANQPYIAKYGRFPGAFDRGSGRATSHNYSMMRYAEVLLIAAEAAVEIGRVGEATNYVNMVRARARQGGTTALGSSVDPNGTGNPATYVVAPSTVPADLATVTVDDVLEERRMELAFEGKRWYDIVRRQLGPEVFGADGYEGAKPEFSETTDYLTPIPRTELERNPNLTQNPF